MTIYGIIYRTIMKIAHHYNWHYAPPIGPLQPGNDMQLWCQWCGLRETYNKRQWEIHPVNKDRKKDTTLMDFEQIEQTEQIDDNLKEKLHNLRLVAFSFYIQDGSRIHIHISELLKNCPTTLRGYERLIQAVAAVNVASRYLEKQ